MKHHGALNMSARVALAGVAAILVASCGGSEDNASPSAGSDDTTPASSTTADAGDEASDEASDKVDSELCETATPLFTPKGFLVDDEVATARTTSAQALEALAAMSDGAAADAFTAAAEQVKVDGPTSPPAVVPYLTGCAASTLDISVDGLELGELPERIPSGVTHIRVSNDGGATDYVIAALGEGKDLQGFLDDMEYGQLSVDMLVTTGIGAASGSEKLIKLDPGTYVVLGMTASDVPEEERPTPDTESLRTLTVE